MPKSIPACMLRLLSVLLVVAGLGFTPYAFAQTDEGATPAQEASPETQSALSQLIEVLRDPDARGALIEELEASMDRTGAAEETAEEGGAQSPGEELRSVGARISDFTRGAVEGLGASVTELWNQLAATPRIFSNLSLAELSVLLGILADVAILLVVTYGGLMLTRRLVAGFRDRLSMMFDNGRWVAKPIAWALELALDIAAALLPYAVGYLLAISVLGTLGGISPAHSLYLNAFLMVEVTLSILRAVVSPNLPQQRLVRITSEQAGAVMGWGRVLVSLLVFGQLLILPLVSQSVSFGAGRAIGMVLMLITLLVGAMAVLAAREPVRHKLERMIESGAVRKGLHGLIYHWHVFALVYIGILAIVALTRDNARFLAYLGANAQVAIAILVGFIVLNIIKRILGNGVTLPEGMRRRSPELQRQINAVVPAVLKVIRFIVIVAVAIFCLNQLGLLNFIEFIESELGARVAGSIVTILLILAGAIVIWIGLNTWVDNQINPELAPDATARKRTLFVLMRNALTIALIVITLMFVLSEVGINIAPLLASAGVLGLAIGFGAQKLVQDIITGIFIQLEGAIDVGDVVSVGGISGVVERLTIRSVSLRDLEGSFHIIPFSSVDTVTNFMRGFSYALINMGVAYREKADEVKQAMSDAFEQLRTDPDFADLIIDEFEWFGVNDFGASEVVFRARIKTLPGQQWGVKRAYNGIVKRIFDERGIEIPFPHQTVYFGEGKDGKAPPLHLVDDGAEASETTGTPPSKAEGAKPSRRKRSAQSVKGMDLPDGDAGPEKG